MNPIVKLFCNTASLATLASFSFISVGNLLFTACEDISVSVFSATGGLAVKFHIMRGDQLKSKQRITF